MDEIYTTSILDLCADIPHTGRLENPDGTATKQAKLCGSSITVDIKMDNDHVSAFAQDVEACDALGKATASLFARHVIGKTYDELKMLRDQMHAMLKENGPPPSGEWKDFALFESVRAYPARQDSTLLVFDATLAAIENAAGKT
ncbi:MAG: iron-sulfur cluster assembly scaffold protein [Pseudomonadota bacterium]